jgi:hypothetical protein
MGYRESKIFFRKNSLPSKGFEVAFYRRVGMEEAKSSCWRDSGPMWHLAEPMEAHVVLSALIG